MPYLVIRKLQFDKTIVIFEINTPRFVKNEFLTNATSFDTNSFFLKFSVCFF